MRQCDTPFDFKINVGHSGIYFMVQDFALYFEDFLMDECHAL